MNQITNKKLIDLLFKPFSIGQHVTVTHYKARGKATIKSIGKDYCWCTLETPYKRKDGKLTNFAKVPNDRIQPLSRGL